MQESIHQAATILLLRENPTTCHLEVYMNKRPDTMRFLPGHYVFPGGQMDQEDTDPTWATYSQPIDPAKNPENLPLSYWITALRETFEEAGILLARHATGEYIDQTSTESFRTAMLNGECTFLEVARQLNVTLATDQLRYFGNRLTPRIVSPKRFDTRYFLAPLPAGMAPQPYAGEVVADEWVDPAVALSRRAEGTMPMVPPTADSLKVLARFHTVDEILTSTEGVGNPTPEELA